MKMPRLSVVALVALAASACSSGGTTPDGGQAAPYIYANVYTLEGGGPPPPWFNFFEAVFVCTDGFQCNEPVPNATVTVNGTALTYDSTSGAYFASFAVAEDASVSLEVKVGTQVYSASGTQFTAAPTVTAPAATTVTWTASSDNTITWTGGAPTAGASYFVQMSTFNPSSGFHQVFPASSQSGELPTTSTSATVPAGTLTAGLNYTLIVGIVSTGAILSDSGGIAIPGAAAGSGLWLGALAPVVAISAD